MKILEFKEFKNKLSFLYEADEPTPPPTPDAADAPAPPPPPPMDTPAPPAPMDTPPPPPGGEPAPAGAPAPGQAGSMKFVFIQEADKKQWHGHHDDEGGVKRFTQYEVAEDELTKWLEVHKFDEDKDLVIASLAGRRPMPEHIYTTFKKEVKSGELGSDKGTIDIKFDSDSHFNHPSTTDLDVVFLKSK